MFWFAIHQRRPGAAYPVFVSQFCCTDKCGFFKEKINGIQKLALSLTYAGIVLAYYGELQIDSSNPDFLTGSLLIFCCAITYAVYIVGSGKMIPVVGATKFTAYTMLAATVGVLLHFAIRGSNQPLLENSGFWRYGI